MRGRASRAADVLTKASSGSDRAGDVRNSGQGPYDIVLYLMSVPLSDADRYASSSPPVTAPRFHAGITSDFVGHGEQGDMKVRMAGVRILIRRTALVVGGWVERGVR